jgi:hypothetical protein
MFTVPFVQILMGALRGNGPRIMAALGSLAGRIQGLFFHQLKAAK